MTLGTLLSCPTCGLIQQSPLQNRLTPPVVPKNERVPRVPRLQCFRCHAALPDETGPSWRNRAATALAASALILLPAAFLLPFLEITTLGHHHRSSLLGGAVSLLFSRQWLIGLVIVVFSILFPVAKLLLILLLGLGSRWIAAPRRRQVFRLVEWVGRWGMIDVLLVAVLIAFIKLSGLIQFTAGPGVTTFTIVVVLSLLSSSLFDPHCLWSEGLTPMTSSGPTTASASTPPSTPAMPSSSPPDARLPIAEPRRRSPFRGLWVLLPIIAGGIVITLLATHFGRQGPLLTLKFDQGHGLVAGNELRHLGIRVGHVESIGLAAEGHGIVVKVRLDRDAGSLARRSSRFWIVRPELDLTRADGLDTIIGEKYLAVRPGSETDPRETEFTGLSFAPLLDLDYPGGIEIILQTTSAKGLRAGLPLFYRSLRIGVVTQIGLSADAGAVEAHAYVRPEYKHIIRDNTKFWTMSSLRFESGLSGLKMYLAPAETWLQGGIELSTPEKDSGEAVDSKHRFTLYPTFEKEWLDWKPALTAQNPTLAPCRLASVQSDWIRDRYWWSTRHSLHGWALPVQNRLIVLKSLLNPPKDQKTHDVHVTIAGQSLLPAANNEALKQAVTNGPDDQSIVVITLPDDLSARLTAAGEANPPLALRAWTAAEDVALITGPDEPPAVIAATRFNPVETPSGTTWRIDSTLPLNDADRGGIFISMDDHAIVGFLQRDTTGAFLLPVTSELMALQH